MRNLLFGLLLVWAIAFFGSFVVYYVTPAKDFGFTAGANRLTAFMAWQAVATVIALVCLIIRWNTKERQLRLLAAIPSSALAVLFSAVTLLIFWTYLQQG